MIEMRRKVFHCTVSLHTLCGKRVWVIKLERIGTPRTETGEPRESHRGAPSLKSIRRELPTTHRVVIYTMVITCSITAAAVAAAAAANLLRLPRHSSSLSSLSFSLVFSCLSLLHLPTHSRPVS